MITDRCLGIFCSALLMAAAACDGAIGPGNQTDAELSCRESYDYGTDAYNDCVAETSCRNSGFEVGSHAYNECVLNWDASN